MNRKEQQHLGNLLKFLVEKGQQIFSMELFFLSIINEWGHIC